MKLELQQGSRSNILAGLILCVMAIFIVRLFYLQVVQHGYYTSLADQEQMKRLVIPAERGLIYALDRDEPVKLVMNQTVYTVFADPQMVTEKAKIVSTMRSIAGGNTRSNITELLDKKKTRYQIIATKVTRKQADKIKQAKLSGIGFQEVSQRVYPEGALASQTLGFVDAEGDGQYGVEGYLNDDLKGTDGLLQSVTDVRDVPLTIGDRNIRNPARNGKNIVLSVDRNVQSYVEQALKKGMDDVGATKGSAIVMNPRNGQVVAVANYPSYSVEDINSVTDAAMFNNGAISVPYEPGSVIKTFTMATGIESGVVTPTTTYVNNDTVQIDDRIINNALKGYTGTRTMQDVLNFSLNTGTVAVMQRLGNGSQITKQARSTLYDYFYNRFGFGHRTGIELANEANGTVISPDEQEGNAVRYANMSFGQGFDATMVQVAGAFSSVVNGGTYYQPTIVAGEVENGVYKPRAAKKVKDTISKGSSDSIRQMLVTARRSASFLVEQDRSGYEIGGKTGTTETIENGLYVKNQTIGSYLGYGGNETPQYVIMVQVSAPGKNLEGGKHAGPIFTDISNWMIDYLRIRPVK